MIGRDMRVALTIALLATGIAGNVQAADLYKGGGWAAMASDRRADQVGDSLTVLIYQTAEATDTTHRGASRNGALSGRIAGGSYDKSGALSLAGTYDGQAQTGRSGHVITQIGVVVDDVLPNGDLHVAGEQSLNINGERIKIRFRGRVRREDISSSNTVVSGQLADVTIDYGGAGFVARGDKPSIVNRLFDRMGFR